MTTIICDLRRNLMGADTHTDYGHKVTKIWRCKKGLFGCAGDDTIIARFEDWILRGRRKPDQIVDGKEEFQAIQLYGGKLYIWNVSWRPEVSLLPYHAVGSGAPWSLGAMDHGATVEEALEIAAKRDSGTKCPFQFLTGK